VVSGCQSQTAGRKLPIRYLARITGGGPETLRNAVAFSRLLVPFQFFLDKPTDSKQITDIYLDFSGGCFSPSSNSIA
jgi:hypothetical protein